MFLPEMPQESSGKQSQLEKETYYNLLSITAQYSRKTLLL